MLGAIGCEIEFLVEPTAEKEWPWIMQCLLEISISTLAPDLKETDENIVNVQLAEEVENIRVIKGFANQIFIAKDREGKRLGFLWVAKTRENFTGLPQAFVLDVYADEDYRRKGIGKRLMRIAEA